MEQTFQNTVREYRQIKELSYRGFADELTEGMVNVSLSGQTIYRWENEPNVAPDLYFLLNCFTTYTDWRKSFAIDALKSIMPHVFDSGMLTFHLSKPK